MQYSFRAKLVQRKKFDLAPSTGGMTAPFRPPTPPPYTYRGVLFHLYGFLTCAPYNGIRRFVSVSDVYC